MKNESELQCPQCGYDLTRHFEGAETESVCPECGLSVDRQRFLLQPPRRWFIPWLWSVSIGIPIPLLFFLLGVLSVLSWPREVWIPLTCTGPLISLFAAWMLYVRTDCRCPVAGPKVLFMICVFVTSVIASYAALVVASMALFLFTSILRW